MALCVSSIGALFSGEADSTCCKLRLKPNDVAPFAFVRRASGLSLKTMAPAGVKTSFLVRCLVILVMLELFDLGSVNNLLLLSLLSF